MFIETIIEKVLNGEKVINTSYRPIDIEFYLNENSYDTMDTEINGKDITMIFRKDNIDIVADIDWYTGWITLNKIEHKDKL